MKPIKNLFSAMIDPSLTNLQQALRVGITLFVACIIYRGFNLGMGYWVLWTSVITVQVSLGASIKRAKDRLLGTFFGVLVGGFCLLLFPNNSIFLITASAILIFFVIYYFYTQYVYAIFAGSILLIILLGHSTGSPWQYVIYRTIDTMVGILIGLVMSYLLWPKNAKTTLYHHLAQSTEQFRLFLIMLTKNEQQNNFDESYFVAQKILLENAMVTNRNLFREFTYEPESMEVATEALLSIILSLEVIYDILMTISLAVRKNSNYLLTDAEKNRINYCVEQIDMLFQAIIIALNKQKKSGLAPRYFDVLVMDFKANLLDTDRVKSILISKDNQQFDLILYTSNIKKLATELRNIIESVKQLNQQY